VPKSKDRNKAVVNSRAAAKPKNAAKPKGAGKPKPKRASQLKAADDRPAKVAKTSLKSVVIDALADMKALEVKVLDVRDLTDIADFMVIASGTSDRHVRSVAQRVVEKAKQAGFRPHGVEGQQDGDWVLIDLHEMIVHVMLPRVREFYGLEKLWDLTATKRAARA
jgi:ribosome-associated protein